MGATVPDGGTTAQVRARWGALPRRTRAALVFGGLVGLLTVWLGVIYAADLIAQSRVPVALSQYSAVRDYSSSGFAFAEGTWVIDGEAQAFPLQTTKIMCRKDSAECVIATAEVSFGKILQVNVSTLPISQWTTTQVVFADDSPGSCADYVYTLDLATKTANGVRHAKRGKDVAGIDCGGPASELRLNLTDGFKVAYKLRQDALPWFGRLAVAPLRLFAGD